MITVSLQDFALTGHFGPVTLGMHVDEVIMHLGAPDGINRFGKARAGLYYARYEFFYSPKLGSKITGIQNDFLLLGRHHGRQMVRWHHEVMQFQNDHFRIDTWFLKPGKDITYSQVLTLLLKEGIAFEEKLDAYAGWQIWFPSGVFLDFSYAHGTVRRENPPSEKAFLRVNGMRLFERSQ